MEALLLIIGAMVLVPMAMGLGACASGLLLAAFGLFALVISAFRETGWVLNRAIKTGTLRVFICRILGGGVAALSAALLVLAVMPEFFGLDPHHFTILEDIDGFWVLCLPFLVGGILVLCLTSHRYRGRRSHSWRDI